MPLGAYKPIIMYFGMTNSPSTFQQMMNDIFNDMYTVIIVYLNNMCIFTQNKSNEEHSELIKKVLCRLCENDLYVKPQKCIFNADNIDFWGMTVSADGVSMQSKKLMLSSTGQPLQSSSSFNHSLDYITIIVASLTDLDRSSTPSTILQRKM
jgi:hypothetical protein